MDRPSPSRSKLRNLLERLLRDRRGATAVEYGLILALITLCIISAVVSVADVTTGMWNNVNATVQNAH